MRILVTGGTGYIGSHTVLSLLEAGHEVVVIDNLANSSEESLRRVAELSGQDRRRSTTWTSLDEAAVDAVFAAARGRRRHPLRRAQGRRRIRRRSR